MTEQTTVARLGRDLGIGINGVLKIAKELGINVTTGGARLAPAQAEKVRQYQQNKADGARRVEHLRAQAPATLPRPLAPPARLAAPATQPGPPGTHCSCCGLRMRVHYGVDAPLFCDICAQHHPEDRESVERRLERLEEHEARLLRAYQASHARALEIEKQRDQAYRSRDAWRRVLLAVVLAHEEKPAGGCSCGDREYPCRALKAIERTNPGISRQLELAAAEAEEGEETSGEEPDTS